MQHDRVAAGMQARAQGSTQIEARAVRLRFPAHANVPAVSASRVRWHEPAQHPGHLAGFRRRRGRRRPDCSAHASTSRLPPNSLLALPTRFPPKHLRRRPAAIAVFAEPPVPIRRAGIRSASARVRRACCGCAIPGGSFAKNASNNSSNASTSSGWLQRTVRNAARTRVRSRSPSASSARSASCVWPGRMPKSCAPRSRAANATTLRERSWITRCWLAPCPNRSPVPAARHPETDRRSRRAAARSASAAS